MPCPLGLLTERAPRNPEEPLTNEQGKPNGQEPVCQSEKLDRNSTGTHRQELLRRCGPLRRVMCFASTLFRLRPNACHHRNPLRIRRTTSLCTLFTMRCVMGRKETLRCSWVSLPGRSIMTRTHLRAKTGGMVVNCSSQILSQPG